MTFDAAGDGHQLDGTGGSFLYPRGCLVTGTIGGRTVGCLSVEQQLLFHRGYEPRAIDLADIAALHELAAGA